jgi:hypothetical protein
MIAAIKTINAMVSVWVSDDTACLFIENDDGHSCERTYLTVDKIDELIRALAAARVEISKEQPE